MLILTTHYCPQAVIQNGNSDFCSLQLILVYRKISGIKDTHRVMSLNGGQNQILVNFSAHI